MKIGNYSFDWWGIIGIIGAIIGITGMICSLTMGSYASRRILSYPDRLFQPSFGWCERCKMTWGSVAWHDTAYGEAKPLEVKQEGNSDIKILSATMQGGMFALCENCWQELTPKQRLPYYRAVFDGWVKDGCKDRDWKEIEKAVLAGG